MCNFLEYFLMGKLELHFPSNINNFWTIYDAYKFASDIFLPFQIRRSMSKSVKISIFTQSYRLQNWPMIWIKMNVFIIPQYHSFFGEEFYYNRLNGYHSMDKTNGNV